MKRTILLILITLIIILVSFSALYAQQGKTGQPTKNTAEKTGNNPSTEFWITIIVALVIGFIGGGGIIVIYQHVKREKIAREQRFAELAGEEEFKEVQENRRSLSEKKMYCNALKNELGYIDLLGSPNIENRPVKLEDAFVSLCISESWRSEYRYDPDKNMQEEFNRHLTPEQVMKRAFQKHRLLLVIGDPGSGKTTLVKYYAVNCLDNINKGYKQLGFSKGVLPLYFPLRELEFNEPAGGVPVPRSLPENLAKWADRHLLTIPANQFLAWLQKEKTLVLLDGLDEISSPEKRIAVCRWIKDMVNGLENAYFVVTSRATGYRKLDGIELEIPHARADIMDFSSDQQAKFLKKWFRAVCKNESPPPEQDIRDKEWKVSQIKQADQQSQSIIEYLNREDNKALRDLAAVPMLLQIMAIIWKYSRYLPQSRTELYDTALNYLLDFRDRHRNLFPLLNADKARRVLQPVALWMQEKLKRDEVAKEEMHNHMQPILKTLDEPPEASVFCDNLRERAGIIAEYDKNHYIFRHKSFREFLAALQMAKEAHQKKRIKTLVNYFKEDWWEETLRFFIAQADDELFNRFMEALFQSPVSNHLDDNKQTLLLHLVTEAPQKKVDALASSLNSDKLNDNQQRYVMDCLRTIATPEAMEAIENADKSRMTEAGRSYAEEIIAESRIKAVPQEEFAAPEELKTLDSFRNPIEGGVEYIKIPGGTYKYSLTKKMVTVPDLYFCKYLVTNQRYRCFIAYLQRKEPKFEKMLPLNRFANQLLKFASSIEERYSEYLGKQAEKWQEKFCSRYDDEKKFKGSDQPVVAVSWYAARAYCFWLSCLETVLQEKHGLDDIDRLSKIYRLPREEEWEWAAGGNSDGSVRKYPWLAEKGDPNPDLANYNKNVNATTPVGRYPEGATPHGLMDMAGNAWEYMENLYKKDEKWRALRGGSWYNEGSALLCSARLYGLGPAYGALSFGFRVCRAQSL